MKEELIMEFIEVDRLYPADLSAEQEGMVLRYRTRIGRDIARKGDLYVKAMMEELGELALKNIRKGISSREKPSTLSGLLSP